MSQKFSERLLACLDTAHCVVAFTGAGVSAESGVPTFRGTDGIWKKFKPEDLANVDAFMRNPELVWEWYAHRKRIMASIEPNAGHRALVEMEQLFESVSIVTQNIDNLHRRAGSTRVFELHGNIERNYCIKCGARYTNEDVLNRSGVPVCNQLRTSGAARGLCGGLIRPDVVWFGEMLPEEEWDGAVKAAESSDVFLCIGTSGVVYPAASIPQMAKKEGAFLVEINPEPTPITDITDEFLQGPSGVILPALCEQLIARRKEHPLQQKRIDRC
jgi:NAD-dependent deacetylase